MLWFRDNLPGGIDYAEGVMNDSGGFQAWRLFLTNDFPLNEEVVMKREFLKVGWLVLALLGLASAELTAKDLIYKGFLSNTAVDGYDAVAYFTEGKPVPGKKEFQVDYQGAVWQFSSRENLAAFKTDPRKYAPQYGGYCAWAVSQGYTAKGDPKFWSIQDGRLFLNYNADVQDKWLKDTNNLIGKADRNWPAVIQ